MKIPLGYNAAIYAKNPDQSQVFYDTEKLINGHMLLVGKSGSGKTHTIREFLEHILKQKTKQLRVHIIDVHGDIDIEGASSVKFSESTNYGFNPLVINPDPDFGGVRKRIQSFISSLNRTGFKLGGNQEATLRNLLLDLYAANGIYDKNPNSWKNKRSPTIEDLYRFTNAKMRSMFLGTSGKGNPAISFLEKTNKLQNKLFRKLKSTVKASPDELADLKEELAKLKEQTIESYTSYVTTMQTGQELDDLLKYDSLDVMKSLTNKIDNLNNIGIFKNEKPTFDVNSAIWRYDIKALDFDEKALFVSFLCEQLFFRAVQRGLQDDVVEIIVLDEAHLFINDDPRNPINTIAKEARKFGLALIAASQSPTHFSDDFLSSVGTKILLGIDQTFWNMSMNKLKITLKDLEWIVFHKKILVQLTNKGDSKNNFLWLYKNKPS